MKETKFKNKILSTSLVLAMLLSQTAFINAGETPSDLSNPSIESTQISETAIEPQLSGNEPTPEQRQDVMTSAQKERIEFEVEIPSLTETDGLNIEPFSLGITTESENGAIEENASTDETEASTEPLATQNQTPETTDAAAETKPVQETSETSSASNEATSSTVSNSDSEVKDTPAENSKSPVATETAQPEQLDRTDEDQTQDDKAAKNSDEEAKKLADAEAAAKQLAAEEEAAKLAEAALYEYTPRAAMPSSGYPVDQNSLILSTQFNGTSINGQSTFDSVGQLWTYNGSVYISVLTNMGTDTLYIGANNELSQTGRDELGALEPLLIDHDNNPATAALVYPVGGTSGSTKKEHWSVFRYSLSSFLGIMQKSTTNSFLLTLIVGQGHWIKGYLTVLLPVVTANLTKTWQGGPMTPVTINLYRKIEGGTEYLYDTVTLSQTNGIATKTWTNLAYTNTAGQVWIYRIDEADPGQGYDAQFSSSYNEASHTYTFTLINEYILTPKDYVINGKKTIDSRPIAADEKFQMMLYNSDAAGTQGTFISQTYTNLEGSFSFPALTFEVAGTFYYLIKEVPGTNAGMSYDTEGKIVAVTVTDNQDGTLSVAMSPASGPLVQNKYLAEPTSVRLDFNKVLNGRTLQAGEFSFSLYRATNASGTISGDALQTATNNADGTVSFTLNYVDGEEGLYYYTVKENIPLSGAGGISYNSQILVFPVYVYDDNLGRLQSYIIPPQDPNFYNAYSAQDVSLTLRAKKNLIGRALKAGEFSFQLLDENQQVVASGTNNINGDIIFSPALTFSDQDLDSGSNVDSYTFTVRELVPVNPLGGVSYDMGVKTLTVKVTDNGDGTMSAVAEGEAVFNNVYTTASLPVDLPVTKTLLGRSTTGVTDEFTFTLNGANPYKLSFTGNDTKTFNYKLNYTLADLNGMTSRIFEYSIAELSTPAIPGIIYDEDLEDTVRVTVSDNGDGTLKAVLAGTAAFTNRYEIKAGSWTPQASKQMNGLKALAADDFSFEVLDQHGEVVSTGKNNAGGSILFSPIEITEENLGTHLYVIREVKEQTQGIVYDKNQYTVTLVVSDNGDGSLNIAAHYPEGGVTFMNVFQAAPIAHDPPVEKRVEGAGAPVDAVFNFSMKAVTTGAPMPDGSVNGEKMHSIKGAGSFEFGEMVFTEPGSYIYELRELPTEAAHFSIDTTVYRITIEISSDNGLLKKAVVYTTSDGTTPVSSLVFTNKYEAPTTAKPKPLPRTGEQADGLILSLLSLIAVIFMLILWKRKRAVDEDKEF